MSDLFGNHIVGFPTRRLILCMFVIFSYMFISDTFNIRRGIYSQKIKTVCHSIIINRSTFNVEQKFVLECLHCFYITCMTMYD